MKRFLAIFLSAICFTLCSIQTYAEPNNAKIAIIDIHQIISSSQQVKDLKKAQEQETRELSSFMKKSLANINKQTDEDKKLTLTKEYEKEFKIRQDAIIKKYSIKFKAADADITAQIGKIATQLGYTIVIPKNIVVFGGDDITEEIIKVIK